MMMVSKLTCFALLFSASVYAAPAGNATVEADTIEIAPMANEPANLVGWCITSRPALNGIVNNGQMFCEIQQNGQRHLTTYKYYLFNSDWNEVHCTSNNNLSVCVSMFQCSVRDSNGHTFVSQGCGGNMPCMPVSGAEKAVECREDFNKGIRI